MRKFYQQMFAEYVMTRRTPEPPKGHLHRLQIEKKVMSHVNNVDCANLF